MLDACYSVAITKFSQEVEKEFNNILDILKRSNNNLNEIARENQLAWDSYKTNVCLYNELDYDPRYFDKENKYFFDISLCVIDASNNRLDQLDQIKKQFLNTKIFYLLNINFKIEYKYDVEPNQVYNQLIMKIHSINSSNKEQKLAFLEKIHQSWQVYRNSSCLLETVPYRENDKEYKSFMDSCLMEFNTVYLKKLNDYLNNEIKK